ncbi:hypothetical protein TeGR_g4681, partial [Tetraparma gracilis]
MSFPEPVAIPRQPAARTVELSSDFLDNFSFPYDRCSDPAESREPTQSLFLGASMHQEEWSYADAKSHGAPAPNSKAERWARRKARKAEAYGAKSTFSHISSRVQNGGHQTEVSTMFMTMPWERQKGLVRLALEYVALGGAEGPEFDADACIVSARVLGCFVKGLKGE